MACEINTAADCPLGRRSTLVRARLNLPPTGATALPLVRPRAITMVLVMVSGLLACSDVEPANAGVGDGGGGGTQGEGLDSAVTPGTGGDSNSGGGGSTGRTDGSGGCEDTDPVPDIVAPALGESCSNRQCEEGLSCVVNAASNQPVCVLPPELGEGCQSHDNVHDGRNLCAAGGYCELDTCVPELLVGQGCMRGNNGSSGCEREAFCTTANNDGVCEPAKGPGGDCFWQSECRSELTCLAEDGHPLDGSCVKVVNAGQDCSEPFTVCEGELECMVGLCQPPAEPTQPELPCPAP